MKPFRQCMNSYGKAKVTHKTFEDAVTAAKNMNSKPKTIYKQVAYKCNKCLRFHTGRSKHNTKLVHNINIYDNEHFK